MKLDPFSAIGLTDRMIDRLLSEHEGQRRPRLDRLWNYYRNPVVSTSGDADAPRRYSVGQETGLPARFRTSDASRSVAPVIENDIGWRVDSMVDFVFGKPLVIRSTARDPGLRELIERILDAVFEASGGITLFQDMALLGGVFGFVDLILRPDDFFAASLGTDLKDEPDRLLEAVRRLTVEVIEPRRMIPLLNSTDYRTLDACLISAYRANAGAGSAWDRLRTVASRLGIGSPQAHPSGHDHILEIHSDRHRQVYIDGVLEDEAPNLLGELPVVHVQNASQPFHFEGLSDVEPLIPLQDELNTRLSDRAHRVTLQSLNMYLAKGIDGFGNVPVRPGQVWLTDNPDASVEAFGGDGHSPSEESHITEIREAMDKLSSVSPLAAGVLRERIGHLSSENALRVTLMGVLSKAARKRVSYGRAISDMSRLILKALHVAGALHTDPRDRGVRLAWQDPLPTEEREQLAAARLKLDLGVARETVLAEIGYASTDPGVQ